MSPDQPVPQGDYVPARRHGTMIYTSGMTPRQAGVLIQTGPVRPGQSLAEYRDAVRLACANAVAAARGQLQPGEQIGAILSLSVFIAAAEGFTAHSGLADFASEYLRETLGEAGIGSRMAVGVATLPGNAPVEIQIVATV